MVLMSNARFSGTVCILSLRNHSRTHCYLDARPDFAAVSSDNRFEQSASHGLLNIHLFLHPQVYITDDPRTEEGPFLKAARSHGVENDRPVISLPYDASRNLKWMTRMDSGSLRRRLFGIFSMARETDYSRMVQHICEYIN